MSADSILQEVAKAKELDQLECLDLCLEYIENQKDDAAFLDFLRQKTECLPLEDPGE